ncbi:MAG: hypothetical protein ACN6OP_08250, partial [Pseudomonadales bacterium]
GAKNNSWAGLKSADDSPEVTPKSLNLSGVLRVRTTTRRARIIIIMLNHGETAGQYLLPCLTLTVAGP